MFRAQSPAVAKTEEIERGGEEKRGRGREEKGKKGNGRGGKRGESTAEKNIIMDLWTSTRIYKEFLRFNKKVYNNLK